MQPNIKQAVPFFAVTSMERSLRYYVDGLGFEMINKWVPREKVEWCYLRRGGGDLMLQELRKEGHNTQVLDGKPGSGISICFMCEDALQLYHEFSSRGIEVSEPFVGNGMWVASLSDPDGYRLEFESVTDTPEETRLSELKKGQ
jgi:catechol 2,3-dioxygenase-like lactoylglutathione lyase family enzyme